MKNKLYIKAKCSICRGKILGCPYCDSDGLTYIEASDNIIADSLSDADIHLKKIIAEQVLGINYEVLLELSSSHIAD